MKYKSTRGGVGGIDFQHAVLMGLADDGGLTLPESIPDVRGKLADWATLSYADLAFEIIRLFATDIPETDLKAIIEKTYGERYFVNDTLAGPGQGCVAPAVKAGDVHILELWHGPTLAFKDVALQLLGNLFEYILGNTGGTLTILGATSGDTGSAAIYGCRSRDGIEIFIMHPAGRVSPIQQRQMTTVLDENVHNIALDGSFDDCQHIMKSLAADLDFKRAYSLGAVNSVNWARVLAQIVYYFYGVFQVQRDTGKEVVDVAVPTGNFGDVLAGWFAQQMGLPIGRLILATNENDILARFFARGDYSIGDVKPTLSPSMDIQVASNFERYLYYRLGEDAEKLSAMMAAFAKTGRLEVAPDENGQIDPNFATGAADTKDVLKTIADFAAEHHYILDPHTACGVAVGLREKADAPLLCLATAHPAKFPAAIEQATGDESLAHHPAIDQLMKKEERQSLLPNDEQAVKQFIIDTLA